jgi:hypothetical protein
MGDSIKKFYEQIGFHLTSTNEVKQSDTIVEDVIHKFNHRSKIGIKKYNTTLAESKEGELAFLVHLQEELMDSILYIEKLLKLHKNANKNET